MKRGVIISRWGYQCQRCGTKDQQAFARFYDMYQQQDVTYCRRCASQTQANTLQNLQAIRKRKPLRTAFCFVLPFALTQQQRKALFHLRGWMWPSYTLLLHAVCGAGKTEIIAALIADALQGGQYVGWAIARKDVVIEITQRLRLYFPKTKISGLYQNSPDLNKDGQLLVLTTARLYDFYHFFDILIIDENDAFPFSVDAGQKFAARNAIVHRGITLHISATVLQKQRKDYQYIGTLARRFHGYDLPAITFQKYRIFAWWRKQQLGKKIREQVKYWLTQRFPIFIFVSNKKLGRSFTVFLQNIYGTAKIKFVSSDITDRTPILQALRDGKLGILVTTTILERGVTYKNLQVIVLDADAALFDAQTLIQIAGRVGRSIDAPSGAVIFCYQMRITQAMRQARVYHDKANRGEIIFL